MKKLFNFTNAKLTIVKHGVYKDTKEKGLRFKKGLKRTVFLYEKRIFGRKGSAVTFTIGAFPLLSVEEARQEARRLATLCEKGIDPRTAKKPEEQAPNRARKDHFSFGSAIKMFFDAKKELKPRSVATYRSHFKLCPKSWLSRDVRDINAEMLESLFHKVRETRHRVCWNFLKTFNGLWNTCSRLTKGKHAFGTNPVPVVHERLALIGIQKNKPTRIIISEHNLGRFVVTLENMLAEKPRFSMRAMIRICLLNLFTGMRFNEARTIRWEHVDMEQGLLFLPGDNTKNGHDHWLPLSDYAHALLRTIKKEQEPGCLFVFQGIKSDKPVRRNDVALPRISKRLGFPYSPHASRRTFASIADEVGLGFLTVKRMLNHNFEGGVTGGYVSQGFNPTKNREHFQKVCDYILDHRAEFLGEKVKDTCDKNAALAQLKRTAIELGLDPEQALEMLARESNVDKAA